MQNFIVKTLLLNKAGDPGGGAGGPPAPPKQDPPQPPAGDPPAQEAGDKEYDKFGYEIPKEKPPVQGDKKPAGDNPPKDPPAPPAKVEKPGTGYDKEPVVEDPPPAEPPKDPPAPPPTDLDKKLEGIHPAFLDDVKAEIADLELKGPQLDKFIARRKDEQKKNDEWAANREKEIKRQKQEQNRKWYKELKEDPVFGGAKLDHNVAAAEKFLDEYGAEFKKELTDAEQMLRPSVMRMLARAWNDRNPEPIVTQGDPPAAQREEETEESNPLDFYTN